MKHGTGNKFLRSLLLLGALVGASESAKSAKGDHDLLDSTEAPKTPITEEFFMDVWNQRIILNNVTREALKKDANLLSYRDYFQKAVRVYKDEDIFQIFRNNVSAKKRPLKRAALEYYREQMREDEKFLDEGYGFYIFGFSLYHFYKDIHGEAKEILKDLYFEKQRNLDLLVSVKETSNERERDVLKFLMYLSGRSLKKLKYVSFHEWAEQKKLPWVRISSDSNDLDQG